jgi:hypothetical protein
MLDFRIYIADDPGLSDRARRFLRERSHRGQHLSESTIRSSAASWRGPHGEPAAEELIKAIVAFEERCGGLSYRVLGSNKMEYGLDNPAPVRPTPFGTAFTGILDGDWTWDLDVLPDGRTAMGPGRWPYRVIDRTVDQRIERHALLVEVRGWHHRTFECNTPPHVPPMTNEESLPPPVIGATGPAEFWWSERDVAVQAQLAGWPSARDRWTVRYFAKAPQQVAEANSAVYAAAGHETVPATWCALCRQPASPGRTCPP